MRRNIGRIKAAVVKHITHLPSKSSRFSSKKYPDPSRSILGYLLVGKTSDT